MTTYSLRGSKQQKLASRLHKKIIDILKHHNKKKERMKQTLMHAQEAQENAQKERNRWPRCNAQLQFLKNKISNSIF